ncbi:hypothetical protein ACIP93_24025 [Streptomyces sp. NPDC088745]|uniref:hypothetical protein n=1 Tax=Streptomyces sp. NPDC088745 TaxID=3365884 RepID=UPI003818C756
MLDHVLAPMYIHVLFGAGVTPEYVDGLAQRIRRRRNLLHRSRVLADHTQRLPAENRIPRPPLRRHQRGKGPGAMGLEPLA